MAGRRQRRFCSAAFLGPWLARDSQDWFSVPFLGCFMGLAALYGVALGILGCLDLPSPPAPEPNQTRRPTRDLIRQPVMLAAIAAAALGYSVMNLAMTATPLAMAHAGHGFAQVTSVIQWHVLAMFAPSFVTGRLIQRFGYARMILLGAGCLFASLLFALAAPDLWAFGVGLLLLGLGWNFTFLPASAWLTTTYQPSDAPRVQAINDCAVFGLTSLSALLAGPLNAWLGWQTLNLLLLPLVAMIVIVLLSATRKSPARSWA